MYSYLGKRRKIDPVGDNLESIVNDVLEEEMLLVVKETARQMTDDHLDKAKTYDMSVNLLTELIYELGPELVSICSYTVPN